MERYHSASLFQTIRNIKVGKTAAVQVTEATI
jgi:hypothetical protein